PRESHLVPADLGDAQAVGEAANPPGQPAEARRVPLLAVLEQNLEPDADAEEGRPVLLHSPGERIEEVGFADLFRLRHQPTFEPEPLERVDDAGGVAGSVVDHVDHAGSVYVAGS